MKQYKLLTKAAEYDKKAVEELVELTKEVVELRARLDYLEEIVEDNAELKAYIWVTADREPIALHNLTDEHLSNILHSIIRNDGDVSKELKSEARSRNLPIPSATFLPALTSPESESGAEDWDW